ncbi:hypothetical protein A4F85_03110 [Delftia sp. GW456-R20]|nr:hypothetical protein A4F85_03110 [Delftia sp. GW456-R20]
MDSVYQASLSERLCRYTTDVLKHQPRDRGPGRMIAREGGGATFLGRQLVVVELSAVGPKSPFAQLVSMTAMQRLLALMPVSSAFDHGRISVIRAPRVNPAQRRK